MINLTHTSYLYLTAYFDIGLLKYLYFLILLSVYVLIIVTNVFLIVVICVNRSLHEPMYLFLCSLFVNELCGSAALYPFLLFQILSEVHTVSVSLCFLQLYFIHSYVNVEFTSLAVMSYDRYLAICCPLHYNTQMRPQKVFLLILLAWLYSFSATVILVSLSVPLRLCGNIIHKIYCDNYSIVKLACSDITVQNIYGMVYTVFSFSSILIVIGYTYMRILKVCFSGSKQTRQKAVNTCTPHLASLINFTFGVLFEIIQNRFNKNNIPNVIRIILSFYLIICQPFFNPLAYGLKMTKIQSYIKNYLEIKYK